MVRTKPDMRTPGATVAVPAGLETASGHRSGREASVLAFFYPSYPVRAFAIVDHRRIVDLISPNSPAARVDQAMPRALCGEAAHAFEAGVSCRLTVSMVARYEASSPGSSEVESRGG